MRFPAMAAQAVLLVVVVGTSTLHAQGLPEPMSFAVRAISHDATDRPLQRSSAEALVAALLERGAEESDHPQWMFLVAATPIEGDRVALSVAALGTIPDRVVEWATEAEIFYAAMSEETRTELPQEGKSIRQYVSEQYIRQFAMPQDLDVLVVERSSLTSGMRAMAGRFFERHIRY